MNVAPARNCVSTSHLAAATCHYCTITVCTTIVCDAHKLRRDSVRRFSFPIFAISRVHSEGGVGGGGGTRRDSTRSRAGGRLPKLNRAGQSSRQILSLLYCIVGLFRSEFTRR